MNKEKSYFLICDPSPHWMAKLYFGGGTLVSCMKHLFYKHKNINRDACMQWKTTQKNGYIFLLVCNLSRNDTVLMKTSTAKGKKNSFSSEQGLCGNSLLSYFYEILDYLGGGLVGTCVLFHRDTLQRALNKNIKLAYTKEARMTGSQVGQESGRSLTLHTIQGPAHEPPHLFM